MSKFGIGTSPTSSPPATQGGGGKFGIGSTGTATPTTPYAAPVVSGGLMNSPTAPENGAQRQDRLYRSAVQKVRAGQSLTPEEATAVASMEATGRTLAGVGVALQPFQVLSDLTKGLIGEAQGKDGSFERGVGAAAGHLTYGAAEYLPGLTGARARGVTGADLLKGTRYEGNTTGALAVELLADPSILLMGAGLVAKGSATLGRLASLEKLAGTPEGAALIRGALEAANTRGTQLLRASDEVTGVPAVVRGVGNSKAGQAVKGSLSRLADTQLPGNNPAANAIRREGGGTIGDAFLTPDQKAAIYTPEQLARDEFRNATRLGADDYAGGIKSAAQGDAQVVATLTRGLGKTDAAEVNRLLGVFTTTTKPEVAAEALRKLTALGQRVGRDLEPPFVAAVKAVDRVGQVTLGRELKAQGLPVVLDPQTTSAIQAAQNGTDLVVTVGKYTTSEGRPRPILMTQFKGRDDVAGTVQRLAEGPQTPAAVTVDPPTTVRTLTASIEDLPPSPPRPIEPVETPGRGQLPQTPASVLQRLTETPVQVTPRAPRIVPTESPRGAGGASAIPSPTPVPLSPAQVLDSLFGPSTSARVTDTLTARAPGAAPVPQNAVPVEQLLPPAPPPSTGGRTPADVLRETLAHTPPAPRVPPVDVPAANTAQDLREGLGNMGGGIADSMYDMLFRRYQAGKTDELGQPSSVLMGAAQLKARGMDLSREQFPDFAQTFTRVLTDARGESDFQQRIGQFLAAYTPPSQTPTAALSVTESPARTVPGPQDVPATAPKTPADVLRAVLAPATDPYVGLPSPAISRTDQATLRGAALPTPAPERQVLRSVPTTYRTVEVDANALDWASLPDNSARRAVLNSIAGAGNARFIRDAQGAMRLDRPNLTMPLSHPTIGHYFDDATLMGAQRQGTDLGERTITRQEQVPDWFNPRERTPLDLQRAHRQQALREANDEAFSNDLPTALHRQAVLGDDGWVIGDAYASYERHVKPGEISSRAATNSYAARVRALTSTPPTPAEVFRYRLALARYRRAVNLRTFDPVAVVRHLDDFYALNPSATLYEGVLNTARAFDLGGEGAQHLQRVLSQAESGFERQMSTLERLEFAQYVGAQDALRHGGGGGLLIERLKRRPETVSQEFQQVFEQDVNALKVLDEQVRTRTAALVRQQTFRQYRTYLEQSGQIVTQKQLAQLRRVPEHQLTPAQLELRRNAATAVSAPGAAAGWKVMDREVEGFFQRGDVIPWWAYFDLFGAGSVDDAAVAASTLHRGGLDVYNRLWSSMNAQLLGTPTSIVNDQIGQLLQMALWGVTPDAVIEGLIRRATASAEDLALMRQSGIQSAKLEANLGATRDALHRLAKRLDGDTDTTRMERVVDGILRFRERGTGIDRTAMTGLPGVVADVAHLGSGYLFQIRSAMSDLQRESLYFHRIALGDLPEDAARFANDVLMDMRLVPAYARVIRRFWPFFNWIAMSGPRSIVTVLRKPGLNAAYQRTAGATDSDDPRDDTRRILARDGGYFNLGIDERNGARLYLDPRNWDPTNTIPQLLDWSGTKVGAVGLPWYASLLVSIQWGQDRFGRNIYAGLLDGGTGGFTEAYKANPKGALTIAAKTIHAQFNPSYAPGSSRAQAFVRSVLATAQLPDDGSRDITLARMLANSPQGRAYLSLMQNGSFALIDRELTGVRESPYSDAAPSMARAAANFLVPIRAVNADQNEQGSAQQTLSVDKLKFESWLAGERKRLAQLEAGGASESRIREEEEQIEQEAERRGARLDYLDTITR